MATPLSHFSSLAKPTPGVPLPPHCLMTVAMPQQSHQSYWAAIEADIDAHLKKTVTVRPPATVFEPMHHLVFAHHRTKAPALCLAACELVGGDRTQAATVAAASALHLVHAAARTHEHLQLSGETQPDPHTSHAYGPNIELLTGDGIVPFALELLARSVDPARKDSDRVLRAIVEITRAIGPQGFIGGRYKEIKGKEQSAAHAWEKKEGELHACGAACGAILGGASEEEIERLRAYGLYVGMIHEIIARGDDEERTAEMRQLALKQLYGLHGREIEPLASLVEANLRVS
ncbi:heterodimeric geranylgeranyl pyrophosphate synthase small subunit, chloroplastic-like [Diospyros lotus]|uniref:heterodimeric geranylgeranyl pyrophosphate synthase small subunit, chloroplastic-like n=1 Tax=Diospyros lotus TaxID=55363 RepID=UPI0022549DFD|nr:heterodimeric geranylgeranyl pyrophosphate synthase small subunit, chloroplastic-like [Diospyros lotus]